MSTWRKFLLALGAGALLGSTTVVSGSDVEVVGCDFNICHHSTGNCQVTDIRWDCREILMAPGCEDCDCDDAEECW